MTVPGSQQKWYLSLIMPRDFKLVPCSIRDMQALEGAGWSGTSPKFYLNQWGVSWLLWSPKPVRITSSASTYCAHRSGRRNPRGICSTLWTCHRCHCAGMGSPRSSQPHTFLGDILQAGHRQKNRKTTEKSVTTLTQKSSYAIDCIAQTRCPENDPRIFVIKTQDFCTTMMHLHTLVRNILFYIDIWTAISSQF